MAKASQPALATLSGARLAWPGAAAPTATTVDLTVQPATAGGHVLLGRNGAGKTMLGSLLASPPASSESWLRSGSLTRREGWSDRSASQVSFESHEALLDEGGTVYRALGVPPGNTPSKAAKFLLVRFGLHPLLYRPVSAISTGEIRKVLLARALATRPSLLVLDNAFDGLDVPSRQALTELISTTLKGFSELLVQGVDARAAAHTQVLLLSHRSEEIVDEIGTFSYFRRPPARATAAAAGSCAADDDEGAASDVLVTEPRDGRSAAELLATALGASPLAGSTPPANLVHALCGAFDGPRDPNGGVASGVSGVGTLLVEASELSVVRGETTLLAPLAWRVRRGEHWLVAGGNGAGKSTLSKLLAMADSIPLGASGHLSVLGERIGATPTDAAAHAHAPAAEAGAAPPGALRARAGVSWVSTELHLSMARSARRAADVLTGRRPVSVYGRDVRDGGSAGSAEPTSGGVPSTGCDSPNVHGAAASLAEWLGLDAPLLCRPFAQLSQGEQKLVLLGAALVARPALLVLDEPLQGLDAHHRTRVLGLVEEVCRASGTCLVYITHYYDEVLPCVTHVMHLAKGEVAFAGERRAYEASGLVQGLSQRRSP